MSPLSDELVGPEATPRATTPIPPITALILKHLTHIKSHVTGCRALVDSVVVIDMVVVVFV